MISKQIEVGKAALLNGAKHVSNLFGKSLEELDVEYKKEDGDTPRTLIDRYSEEEVIKTIRNDPLFADDWINAEETGTSGHPSKGREWYLDPFDGTSNAQIKLPMSTMGIGIREGEDLIGSIIVNPFEKKIYYAEKGSGAFVAPISIDDTGKFHESGEPVKLSTDKLSDRGSIRYAWVDALFNSNNAIRKSGWITEMQKKDLAQNIRMTGSNINYSTMIAEGRGHFQLTDAVGGYFDLCGACLINEAGGRMVNLEGKTPKPGDELAIAVANPDDLKETLKITRQFYEGYKGFKNNLTAIEEDSKQSIRYRYLGMPKSLDEFLDKISKKDIKKINLGFTSKFNDYGAGWSGTYVCSPIFIAGKYKFKEKKKIKPYLINPYTREGKIMMFSIENIVMGELVEQAHELQNQGNIVTIGNQSVEDAIEANRIYMEENMGSSTEPQDQRDKQYLKNLKNSSN